MENEIAILECEDRIRWHKGESLLAEQLNDQFGAEWHIRESQEWTEILAVLVTK